MNVNNNNEFICPNQREKSNLYIPGAIGRFVKDHPTLAKVIAVSAAVLGIAAIVATPPLAIFSIIGIGAAISMGLSGTLVAGITYLGHKALEYTIGYSHDMTDHAYVEDHAWVEVSENPKVTGKSKITYENDIPVLSIQAVDNYSSGYIQGTRLAPQIHVAYQRLKPIFSLLRKFKSFPNSKEDDPRFEKMWSKVPGEYRIEMQGFVEGYNRWAKANGKSTMNKNDLLLFHFLPENHHFSPSKDKFGIEEAISVGPSVLDEFATGISSSGCTALVTKDKNNKIHFGRNMDWLSHNIGGNSLMINRKIGNHKAFIDFSFPLCVGVVTAMNESGLSLSINISPGKTNEYRGTPAIFNNRKFIEDCDSVRDVVNKANIADYQPNGPCHTTIADGETAGSIHFYQAAKDGNGDMHYYEENMDTPTIHVYEGLDVLYPDEPMDHVWEMNGSKETSIVVPNKGYKVAEGRFQPYNHHDSDERIENIQAYLIHQGSKNMEAVKGTMKVKLVNNCETVHHLYLNPENKMFHVAMDNNFAGDRRMQVVDVQKQFKLFE